MGTIIILLLDYIICGLAFYSFVFCRYKLEKLVKNGYHYVTESIPADERIKTPLWQILLLLLVCIIPLLNIMILPFIWLHRSENEHYYYKSFLTKEY